MGLGIGLVLAAAGAILAWGVEDRVSGVDLRTVGWILLVVGVVGAVISLVMWSSWSGSFASRRRRTVWVDEDDADLDAPAARRRPYPEP
jgi:hypothetical protein